MASEYQQHARHTSHLLYSSYSWDSDVPTMKCNLTIFLHIVLKCASQLKCKVFLYKYHTPKKEAGVGKHCRVGCRDALPRSPSEVKKLVFQQLVVLWADSLELWTLCKDFPSWRELSHPSSHLLPNFCIQWPIGVMFQSLYSNSGELWRVIHLGYRTLHRAGSGLQ